MVRRANKKVKKQYIRRERKIILIAAEGRNRTERNYFAEFNRLQNDFHIVFADGNNTDPIKVVKDAYISSEHKGLELEQSDKSFAVIDADFGKEEQIKEARRLAKHYQIGLLISNPCFEVWILQHFRFSTHGYHSNTEVLEELQNRWPNYKKSMKSFEYVLDRIEIAIENARRLKEYHENQNTRKLTEECNPSTDIFELAEIINPEGGGDRVNK